MDDKTLLLKAAQAAGYGLKAREQSQRESEMPDEPSLCLTHATWWNPLTDSGQALDLAVTLGLDIGQMITEGCVTAAGVAFDGEPLAHDVPMGMDPRAATRRATGRTRPVGLVTWSTSRRRVRAVTAARTAATTSSSPPRGKGTVRWSTGAGDTGVSSAGNAPASAASRLRVSGSA